MHCSLNHVLKWFLHGFINITMLAIFGQFIGLFIISLLFVATRFAFSPFGHLLYIVSSIVYYVTIEEVLKLFFSLKSRDSVHDPLRQITKTHTITSTATALGYSMCSGTLWMAFAAYQLHKDDEQYHEKYSLFGWLLTITVIIAVIGMPMQLITGYAIGCKITQKDMEYAENNRDGNNQNNERGHHQHDRLPFHSYLNVIYNSVFVRSAYLFFLVFGFLILQFSVIGVIIAILGIICDYILLIKYTKQIEATLPWDYLQRAGQLSIFGYNVLPDQPDGDQENLGNGNGRESGYENVNEPVQITAVSIENFSVDHNLDEPMLIKKHREPEERQNNGDAKYEAVSPDDPEVHVSDEILDADEQQERDDDDESSSLR